MRRYRITVGTFGIVSRHGDYQKTLGPGLYWLRFSDRIAIYKSGTVYQSEHSLDIMLEDTAFKNMVEVVLVADGQLALKFVDGIFRAVLEPGRYFYFKSKSQLELRIVDLNKAAITENVSKAVLKNRMLAPYLRTFEVLAYEQALLLIDGKFVRSLETGSFYFWQNATKVEVLKTDMRQMQMEIGGQELLTQDKAALRLNFTLQYQVVNIEKALLNSKDFQKQLYVIVQLALRSFVGARTLDELLANKEQIADYVASSVESKAIKLGVKIKDSGIKDVILPGDVKEIMNRVLIAQKQAEANTIARREDTASTRAMLNTAKLMEDNSMLFKLKEMEYVEKIADRIGEITVSGGDKVIDQLKTIFTSNST